MKQWQFYNIVGMMTLIVSNQQKDPFFQYILLVTAGLYGVLTIYYSIKGK